MNKVTRAVSIVIIASISLIVFLFKIPASIAGQNFVQDLQTYRTGKNYIQLQWTTAEPILADATIVVWPNNNNQLASTVLATASDLVNGSTSWFYTLPPEIITEEDTPYTIFIEYAGGTTANGTLLSTFSDYVTSEHKIQSNALRARSRNDTATIETVNISYALPGERIRVFGNHLGTGPSNLASAYAHLGPTNPYIERILYGNYYNFTIAAWTDNYIDLITPTYDANKLLQTGKIYFDDLVLDDAHYNTGLLVSVVNNVASIEKTIASGYSGNAYRYLLNASRYRYGQTRSVATYLEEGTKMRWVGDYLSSIGHGIDAAWSLILAYALVYGGYSENEIQHEITNGPGCLHAFISRDAWSKTAGYTACMYQ